MNQILLFVFLKIVVVYSICQEEYLLDKNKYFYHLIVNPAKKIDMILKIDHEYKAFLTQNNAGLFYGIVLYNISNNRFFYEEGSKITITDYTLDQNCYLNPKEKKSNNDLCNSTLVLYKPQVMKENENNCFFEITIRFFNTKEKMSNNIIFIKLDNELELKNKLELEFEINKRGFAFDLKYFDSNMTNIIYEKCNQIPFIVSLIILCIIIIILGIIIIYLNKDKIFENRIFKNNVSVY